MQGTLNPTAAVVTAATPAALETAINARITSINQVSGLQPNTIHIGPVASVISDGAGTPVYQYAVIITYLVLAQLS